MRKRSVNRPLPAALCLGLLALWPGVGDTRPGRLGMGLGLGLCVPEIAFSGAVERHTFITGVARHLSRALGRPVQGFAYINPRDLRRDLRAGRLHFAIVGGLFASTLRGDQILAQARLKSDQVGLWSIFARSRRPLRALKGQRLQIPRMGPDTMRLVQQGVLGGLDVVAHFKVQWSPDLLSAVKAVRLKQADVLIAPLTVRGLVPLTRGYAVPPPAFVVLAPRQVSPQMVSRARLALLSYGVGTSALHGWYMANTSAYDELSVLLGHDKPSSAAPPGP